MLKLGEKIISYIYLGDKKIAKVFWGDKLVYQAGKPIFLDYLITDGSSYIDSEYHPNENTYVEYTFEVVDNVQTQYNGLFGSRLDATSFAYNFFWYNTLDIRVDWGGSPQPTYRKALNTKYTIKAGLGYITLDEAFMKEYTPKIEGSSPYSIYLGNFNNKGIPYTTGTPQKIYEFKAYENKVLLHDLRPCIDPKGTVCMYDMVTKKYFYNQGTGTLTAGNVIKFVDYIEFDGASWIDTELYANSNWKVRAVWETTTSSRPIYGSYESGKLFSSYVGANWRFDGTPVTIRNDIAPLGEKHTTIQDINGVNVNGTLYPYQSTPSEFTASSLSFYFGMNNSSGLGYYKGKIYELVIWDNDILIGDFRPCVVAGVAGFYDMVTGKIFTNAGTGTLGYTE